jgi:hypothetical protein
MSTFEEIREIPQKYKKYAEQLREIFKKHEIDGWKPLVSKLKTDAAFKKEFKGFWESVAKTDGGKLSLTTMGLIIGAALGGVGIAAMGGAIGLPLAAVLAAGGFLGGSKFDSLGFFSKEKTIKVKVSKEAKSVLEQKAKDCELSVEEYARVILEIHAGEDAKEAH